MHKYTGYPTFGSISNENDRLVGSSVGEIRISGGKKPSHPRARGKSAHGSTSGVAVNLREGMRAGQKGDKLVLKGT
jgi:hypothetical protein